MMFLPTDKKVFPVVSDTPVELEAVMTHRNDTFGIHHFQECYAFVIQIFTFFVTGVLYAAVLFFREHPGKEK